MSDNSSLSDVSNAARRLTTITPTRELGES